MEQLISRHAGVDTKTLRQVAQLIADLHGFTQEVDSSQLDVSTVWLLQGSNSPHQRRLTSAVGAK